MAKKQFLFNTFTAIGAALGITAMTLSVNNSLKFQFSGHAASKSIVLDHSNQPSISGGTGVLEYQYATFTYTNAAESTLGHVVLNEGGTITKDISKGLTSINVVFDGELSLDTSFDGEEYCFSYDLVSNVTQGIRGNYLRISAKSYTDITSISLTYNCFEEELESHTYGEWTTYDDENHERYCTDDHCHKFESEPHTLDDSGIGIDTSVTSGTITYRCSICGFSFEEEYSRTGSGKVALGSSRDVTKYDSKLGSSIQSYAVAAYRMGLAIVNGEGSVVFGMRAAQSPSTDTTGTNAGFRIMSGFTQTGSSTYHSYVYTFKNMGTNNLNFQVYGRNGSSDTSAVSGYDVSLIPGEVKTVNVMFATENANILSYFRFFDDSYVNASLAISLRYYSEASVNVTLTNATFEGGSNTKMFAIDSQLTGIVSDMDYIGFKDNLGNVNQTSLYRTPDRDVEVTLLDDPNATKIGTGKLKINYSDERYLDNYSVRAIFANPSMAFIGDELSTVVQFNSSASGTDNTGTGASFRFRINYNSGSGYKTNLFYTFKNLGTEPLEFDVYQRASGSDTSTPDYVRISIDVNEVATADLYWDKNISSNELTYIRFTEDTNWLNQKMAVYAYTEAMPTSIRRVNLEGGMTFSDGTTSGYYQQNSNPTVIVPSASKDGQSHVGYYVENNNTIQTNTTLTVPSIDNSVIHPVYDIDNYYDGTSALTTSYQKVNLESGSKFHPYNGYAGTFTSSNKPTLGTGVVTNELGQVELASKYSYNGEVTANSHFLNMNTMANTGSKIDTFFVIKNNGSETLKLNLYCTTSSGTYNQTTLATNVVIEAGESVNVEKLNHGSAANGNTMVCFEIIEALTKMDFSVVRYVRLHS